MPNSTRTGMVDAYLSNVSINYIQTNDKFIADKVFPEVPVAKSSDIYLTYPRGYFFRDEVAERPLGGQSPRVEFKTGTDNYNCVEEGLSSDLDDRERANAMPPYDPEKSRVLFLTQQHLIHRDRKWAGKYFKTGVWTNEYAGKSSAPSTGEFLQFDQANSDPIDYIDTIKDDILQRTGFEPNVMVVGRKVFRKLKNHPDIVDRVKYTARGILTAELLKEIFGVDRFLVPGGIQNTAAEGQDDSFDFIVPQKDILLCYAAQTPGIDQPTAGYTFGWRGLLAGQAYSSVVNRGREERNHSDWFEVRMAFDQKLVAQDLGVFLKDAVS